MGFPSGDTMNRRTLLATIGSLTATSAAAIGTGAFTSVSATRAISVDVAADDRALLRLREQGAGRRSFEDGDELGFDFPSPDEDEYGGTDPDGLGPDSVYRFSSDASQDERGLFDITNQGTQPVNVYSTNDAAADEPSVTMYNIATGELLTEDDPYSSLKVGDSPLVCGLEIDTHGVPVQDGDYDIKLIINAVAADDD